MEYRKTAFSIYNGEAMCETDEPVDPEVLLVFQHLRDKGQYTASEYGNGLWVCMVEYTLDGGVVGVRGMARWEPGMVATESEMIRLRGVDASIRTLARTFATGMREA